MGGKGSGRPILSYDETFEEIKDSLGEIRDLLETAHKKTDILSQRVLYYTTTVSKRR
jgi:hypothetical protein